MTVHRHRQTRRRQQTVGQRAVTCTPACQEDNRKSHRHKRDLLVPGGLQPPLDLRERPDRRQGSRLTDSLPITHYLAVGKGLETLRRTLQLSPVLYLQWRGLKSCTQQNLKAYEQSIEVLFTQTMHLNDGRSAFH